MRTNLIPIFVGVFLCSASLAAQDARINARDAFFSAADMVAVNKQGQSKSQKSAKAGTAAPAKPATGGTKTDGARVSGPKPELAASPAVKDAEAHFQLVSQKQQAPSALGLRYSILRKTPNGMMEVRSDSEFKAGDSIRLSVMGNQKGYLYVIARGSSGIWSPLFPHPESSQQSNEIVPGRQYQVPGGPGEAFTFDEQAGEEKLFILLSTRPVQDIEELIQSLAGSGPVLPDRPVQASRPATMQAKNDYDDSWIDKLRLQVQSRDLVFTKVDKDAPAAEKSGADAEQAVYVVNTAGLTGTGTGGRVVVDLNLRHK